MYIHKYVADGDIFYRLAKDSSKPSGSVILSVNDWKARVSTGTGQIPQALSAITSAFAMREKQPQEEEPPKEPTDDTQETQETQASLVPIAEHVRYLSTMYKPNKDEKKSEEKKPE